MAGTDAQKGGRRVFATSGRGRARFAACAAVVTLGVVLPGCGGGGDDAVEAPPARADRRAPVPDAVERYVHETLHRLDSVCSPRRADEPALEKAVERFVGLYNRYPADRFRMKIDDESGTMLSAILVLRDELSRCSPRTAAPIDAVLPPRIRRALRPLRGEP